MPKALEEALKREVASREWSQARKDAYVYGALRKTGWKPARLKAARAELTATDLVVEATRTRAGRSLFLPGGWVEQPAPRVPLERWKLPLFDAMGAEHPPFGVIVPTEPVADLYGRAWQRVRDGDAPRFEELRVRRGRRR